MLHKAWNSKGEMPYCFPRSSIKFQGHTVQNITNFDPNWAFPDYRPVAAFKSLRFALFTKIQPHSFNQIVCRSFHQHSSRPVIPVQWRHHEHDGASNHWRLDCLLKRMISCRSKKTSKLRVIGLCEGNSSETGEFPSQRASNAENVSIWWRHHAGFISLMTYGLQNLVKRPFNFSTNCTPSLLTIVCMSREIFIYRA